VDTGCVLMRCRRMACHSRSATCVSPTRSKSCANTIMNRTWNSELTELQAIDGRVWLFAGVAVRRRGCSPAWLCILMPLSSDPSHTRARRCTEYFGWGPRLYRLVRRCQCGNRNPETDDQDLEAKVASSWFCTKTLEADNRNRPSSRADPAPALFWEAQ
jgi:hypothetical protein